MKTTTTIDTIEEGGEQEKAFGISCLTVMKLAAELLPMQQIAGLVKNHQSGDWGDPIDPPEQEKANQLALKQGGVVRSRFPYSANGLDAAIHVATKLPDGHTYFGLDLEIVMEDQLPQIGIVRPSQSSAEELEFDPTGRLLLGAVSFRTAIMRHYSIGCLAGCVDAHADNALERSDPPLHRVYDQPTARLSATADDFHDRVIAVLTLPGTTMVISLADYFDMSTNGRWPE